MNITVTVDTGIATGTLVLSGKGLSECFEQIPIAAGEKGLALTNDGNIVCYKVRVITDRTDND